MNGQRPVHMLMCAECNLLVGWCSAPPQTFVCIPCFDTVHPNDIDADKETNDERDV